MSLMKHYSLKPHSYGEKESLFYNVVDVINSLPKENISYDQAHPPATDFSPSSWVFSIVHFHDVIL